MIGRSIARARRIVRSLRNSLPDHLSANPIARDIDHSSKDVADICDRIAAAIAEDDLESALQDIQAAIECGKGNDVVSAAADFLTAIVHSDDKIGAALISAAIVARLEPNDKGGIDIATSTSASLVSFLSGKKMGTLPAAGNETADAIDVALSLLLRSLRHLDFESKPGLWLTVMRCHAALEQYNLAFVEMATYVSKYAASTWACKVFGEIAQQYLASEIQGAQTSSDIWRSFPFKHNMDVALTRVSERSSLRREVGHRGEDQCFRANPKENCLLNVLVIGSDWRNITPQISDIEHRLADECNIRTFDFESLTLSERTIDGAYHRFFDDENASKIWSDCRAASTRFAKLVDWCDVIFLPRADASAVALTHSAPMDIPTVAQITIDDLRSEWPYFLNWARLDLVLCSDDKSRQLLNNQNRLFNRSCPPTRIGDSVFEIFSDRLWVKLG